MRAFHIALLVALVACDRRPPPGGEDGGGDDGGANRPPVATILSPEDGAQLVQGVGVELRGEATDPDRGLLDPAALTWTSPAAGVLGVGSPLAVATLPLGAQAITLAALDSGGLSGSATVNVTVFAPGENRPPVARILAPTTGHGFLIGAEVSLQGEAQDAEDGPLSGARLAWSSDRDGPLGTGTPRAVSTLTAAFFTWSEMRRARGPRRRCRGARRSSLRAATPRARRSGRASFAPAQEICSCWPGAITGARPARIGKRPTACTTGPPRAARGGARSPTRACRASLWHGPRASPGS